MKYRALIILVLSFVVLGCASRKSKSSSQIMMEGDRNPFIIDNPSHAGEITRDSPR